MKKKDIPLVGILVVGLDGLIMAIGGGAKWGLASICTIIGILGIIYIFQIIADEKGS